MQRRQYRRLLQAHRVLLHREVLPATNPLQAGEAGEVRTVPEGLAEVRQDVLHQGRDVLQRQVLSEEPEVLLREPLLPKDGQVLRRDVLPRWEEVLRQPLLLERQRVLRQGLLPQCAALRPGGGDGHLHLLPERPFRRGRLLPARRHRRQGPVLSTGVEQLRAVQPAVRAQAVLSGGRLRGAPEAMTALTLFASLVLAAVFAVAAVTKLTDRGGTREAVVAFGAPEWSAGTLALLLPVAELAVAGLLLFPETAAYGAIGALVLLAIFSVAIGVSLARGRAPDCHCFGQLHSAPASWKTLARNGVLAALAVVSLAGNVSDDQASAFAWLGDLESAELLAAVVAAVAVGIIVVGGTAFLTLMRSYGKVLTRLDRVEAALASAGYELDDEPMPELGLAPGTPAPAFSAQSLSGEPASLSTFLETELPAVLLFTSPNCGPCSALMPTVAAWQRDHAETLSVVLVSDGAAEEVGAEAAEHELANVLLDDGHATYEAYEANGTPSAVVIAPDGTIGSWVVAGSEWIERLVEQTAAGDDGSEGLPIGAEIPSVELPSLEGEAVALSSLRGDDALLLFWNPDCGFCRSMHEDVLAWETSTNGVAPRLVVVSSGDAEGTRAEGFTSLVLLDESFEAGSAFGANGTPMAVLVDADGRIASDVVAGAEAVMELAKGR